MKRKQELITRIFAATAASIFTPSPSTSGTSTPINVAHSSTRSWTTTTFGQVNPLPKPGTGVSTAARISKEQARRGLYSRFMRGKVVVPESESEPEQSEGEGLVGDNKTKEVVAGPSTSLVEEVRPSKKSKGKGKETRGEETKEEKRIRKAEKAKRKEEKEARRALKTNQVDGAITPVGDEEGKSTRKRKDLDLGEDGVGKIKKAKKEKKEKIVPDGEVVDQGEKEVKNDKVKKEKKSKSKKDKKVAEES